jgi:hypothetical protein
MGAEVLVPLAISALGVGAQAYGQHQQAVKAEDISTDLLRKQQMGQREADASVNQTLDKFGRSTGEAERQQSLQGFLQQLRGSQAQAAGGDTPSTASDRAQMDAAAGRSAIQNYGTQRADNLSRIVGPGQQRVNEQALVGRTGDEINAAQRNAQMQQYLAQLRMQRNTVDPWLQAGGQLAQSYGSSMAGSGWNPNDAPLQGVNINAQRMLEVPSIYAKRIGQRTGPFA